MWDLNTRKILWTKDYDEEDELVERNNRQITVDCENKYIIINQYNKYNTGKPYPNNYTWLKNNIFYDYNTLKKSIKPKIITFHTNYPTPANTLLIIRA
jgi:hypothetical protein